MIRLFGDGKEAVSTPLAQSIFCSLVIDRVFLGNTSDRTEAISSVAPEMPKEGEQGNLRGEGSFRYSVTPLTAVSVKSHSDPTKSDLVSDFLGGRGGP